MAAAGPAGRVAGAALALALACGVAAWALVPAAAHRVQPPAAWQQSLAGQSRPFPVPRPTPVHPDRFFLAEQFYAGLQAAQDGRVPGALPEGGDGPDSGPVAQPQPQSQPPPLAGGLVPHHLVAGALITDFFLDLARNPPSTIILVGPNHENRGARIATSRLGWATPFGTVAPASDLVDRMVRDGRLVVDDQALAPEHSVGGLMPYIRYHLPEARVVPIILHGDVSLAEVERLAGVVAPEVERGAALVASVDFSHYLTRAEAEERDRETWRAIAGYDLPAIMRMGDDHLDSPASLFLLLATMRRLGIHGPVRTAHTNSGVLMGSDFAETTSYMLLKYRRGEAPPQG